MLKALSVTELSNYVTNIFEAEELLHYLKVYGEVSGVSFVRGNIYFNLKDENSILSCILFGATSCPIKDGDEVMLTGGLKYYAKGGKLNFYATTITPYGSGMLYQKFLELKNKLELDGVFDQKYKKKLPKKINTIGVVSSPTGAVIHDIQTVSHRRNPSLNIIIYPARVQGEGAEKTIIDGIKYFDKREDVDVIVIARGGGSIEDLAPFNTESLAREIIKLKKPVVSSVGHETDFTICDFASSIRAATPSEAAELLSENVFEKMKDVVYNLTNAYYKTCNIIDEKYTLYDKNLLKMNALIDNKILKKKTSFLKGFNRLILFNPLDKVQNNLILCQNSLERLNPNSVLSRGWAKVLKKNKTVKNAKDINVGDKIEVQMLGGSLGVEVKNKEIKNG